ncbi:aminotransferase class I/II-fold pyridoxal phosphate-dependent enzyme [Streptomyces mangrovisoli]|uniref:Aminotransferase class I/II n=1 Tax=Streptomyces mangrovisoli TaxID=1428628 RepID=A0A1J4P2W0_9ACTN|nr:aminotransferase class I/II-fold pyridoxal phosphate-dependent enzyme [Streptomyces mangrovisoli]OIJ67782.1 aminotransferase class I/II [Streptomyces mangrovisoli]
MVFYLTAVGIVTVVYLTVPDLLTPLWALFGLGGAGAVLTGVRLHRPDHRWPWFLLAAGLLAFSAGDTYYNAQEAYFHASNPFPSPADACYLVVYPLFAVGLFGLVRYRWVDRDLPSLLDALIITAGLALPVWVYLVRPLATAEGLTWEQRAISMAYPLGDVLVLAMLVRLLAPSSVYGINRSVQLLFLGTATLLVFDITYGILQLNGTWQAGTALDSGWIIFYTAWGLAALHPSMALLTRPEPRPPSLLPPFRRLVLLTCATLIAPAVLLFEERTGTVHDATVLAAFSTLLFLLVILRLGGMVVAHRKAVAREQTLRTATASLVAATRTAEVARCCETAVDTLFGPEDAHHTLLLTSEQAESLYTHLAGPHRTAQHRTVLVPVRRLSPDIAGRLGSAPTALVCPMVRPDRLDGGRLAGVLLAGGPERRLSEMSDSLDILASQAGLASERIALRQEIIRRENEAYFRTLVHNASDVILIVGDDGDVRYASPSAAAVFGSSDITGTPLRALIHPRDRERVDRTLATLGRLGRTETHDHWWVLRENTRLEVEARCRDLRHDETVDGLVVTLRDVTEQRKLEHELTERAFHDSLTGLPNRTLLLERTGRALLRGRREPVLTCLLFIDLDDFKIVNDTLGHAVGDRLLKSVGRRLSQTLRRTDTAARLGGDEFAVLMEDAHQPVDAEMLAGQVIRSLDRPFQLDGTHVSVSASVGVATAQDSTDAEELLALADLALYAAKGDGKCQWRRYRPQLRVRMAERHDMRARLDEAIAREEFTVRYQPVVDIERGDVVGFEALARWPHVRRAPVPPKQFIPLAEETGHITPLGAWVLRSAAADMARLQHTSHLAEGGSAPPYVSVNVSGRQWRDAGFLDEVCHALDTPGLEPGSLQLELTESVLMQQDEELDGLIRQLKDLGVRIAVDDFGTGYSSLRYLREFPLDVLKIDKTFIDDIPRDPQQAALVEGIVRIADTLGLQVIAEGIEEPAQRDLLSDIGCRYGQGFLFAPPMTLEQGARALRGNVLERVAVPGRMRDDTGGRGTDDEGHTVMRSATAERPRGRPGRGGSGLDSLLDSSPMSDAVLDEVCGRHIRCGDHWLVDFASCNYLGLDWDPEVIDAVEPAVRRWGTHPSWSRLLGSPRLYPDIEERLASLLGAEDTLLLPTITLIHAAVIPVLAGTGHVFVDATAHRTVYDGCVSARGRGATLHRFRSDRPDQLDALLKAVPAADGPRLVCLDGVDSMTGDIPDLPALAAICRDHGATLYVDDAHGFGVIGQRAADEPCPYGIRGNSVVRHTDESYDGIVLVGGFSKAYSSLLAFLALPTALKNRLKTEAGPYLYSGPSPVASLATAQAGLEVNDRRGDALRADLYRKTVRVLDHTQSLDLDTPGRGELPIVEIPLADADELDGVGTTLWERGVYVTLAAYPLVPRDRVGFRVQVTALNSDEDIDRLCGALTELDRRGALRHRT